MYHIGIGCHGARLMTNEGKSAEEAARLIIAEYKLTDDGEIEQLMIHLAGHRTFLIHGPTSNRASSPRHRRRNRRHQATRT